MATKSRFKEIKKNISNLFCQSRIKLKCWINPCHMMRFCMLNRIRGHGQRYLSYLLIDPLILHVTKGVQIVKVGCRVDPLISKIV